MPLRPRLRRRRSPSAPVAGGSAASVGQALEVVLAVRPAQMAALLERLAVADAHEHVLQLAIGRQRVVRVVGHDEWQVQLACQADRFGDEPVVVGQQVVLQLQVERRRRNTAGQAARGVLCPVRSPASSRRAISPWRQPDSAISPASPRAAAHG